MTKNGLVLEIFKHDHSTIIVAFLKQSRINFILRGFHVCPVLVPENCILTCSLCPCIYRVDSATLNMYYNIKLAPREISTLLPFHSV